MHTLAVPFNVGDYTISGTQNISAAPGAQVAANLKLTSSFSYAGQITATCDATALAGSLCSLSPANPITVAAGGQTSLTATLSVPKDALPGTYNVKIGTQDTTGNPTHAATVSLTLAQDFLITSSTPSQSVTAGQTSGPYNLRIQPVGSSFDAPVTLACTSGLPSGGQCLFSPAGPVTPGTSGVDVVMSISASNKSLATRTINSTRVWLAIWLVFPALLINCGRTIRRVNKRGRRLALAALFAISLLFASCGGVSTGGGGTGVDPGNPVTYRVTVSGTSPATPADAGQSTVVTLVVK
ncbi:MAG TPA: hypothetical protein VM715_05815 [Candidatus Acidoferrum sp.]|nr:hypothetical protein [Candidatus Acidoferrum sp.]